MSIAEKLTTIAENQEKVFEAGKNEVLRELKEAQKGVASGEIIAITDISPIEHNLGVKLSDANATLTVFGKNLIPYPYENTTKVMNDITFTDNGDGSITCNGTADASTAFILYQGGDICLPNVTYNLSGCDGGEYGAYDLRISDGKTKAYASYNQNGVSFSYADTSTITISISVSKGQTLNNVVFKPMLEVGTEATPYEPYIQPTSYTPNADGTVEGVKSIYPTTTLMADTQGVLIDAEYIRDLNGVVDELTDAIISLGGDI